tara:strand:- start:491 stop:1624 length:1134 start_codon:yes stop_codon:yes gene_type:complete
MKIKKIEAKRVLNSNENPTIEITVNKKYSCSAPSGNSKGRYEVKQYHKDGLDKSIDFINENIKNFKGLTLNEFEDLAHLEEMKEDIGGSAMIALQGSVLKAISNNEIWRFLNYNKDKMPVLMGNCVGGGKHGKNNVDIQEFLIIPKTKNFNDAKFVNDFIYKRVGQELNIKNRNFVGAWAPDLSNTAILDIFARNVEKASNEIGFDVRIGLDINADNLFKEDKYVYKNFSSEKKEKSLSKDEQQDFINSLIRDYKIAYVEEPFREKDIDTNKRLKVGVISGDDLICGNLERLKEHKNNISAVIIKPTQIGSLIEMKEIIDVAKKSNIIPIMSQRTFETNDDLISHLAVGFEVPYIKLGLFGRSRLSKINALQKIEES